MIAAARAPRRAGTMAMKYGSVLQRRGPPRGHAPHQEGRAEIFDHDDERHRSDDEQRRQEPTKEPTGVVGRPGEVPGEEGREAPLARSWHGSGHRRSRASGSVVHRDAEGGHRREKESDRAEQQPGHRVQQSRMRSRRARGRTFPRRGRPWRGSRAGHAPEKQRRRSHEAPRCRSRAPRS